jgi:hypothetical protein|uniref:hypothetical protein n=1 Tax=Prevotellamassilia timonensis TaxID=1852370 RepID=UPI004024EBF7
MRKTTCKLCIIAVLPIISCCKQSNNIKQREVELTDSIEKLNEMYLMAEESFAYTYLNTNLNVSIDNNKNLVNKEKHNICLEKIKRHYTYYVYIPNYVCYDCITKIVEDLRNYGCIKQTLFIIPLENDYGELTKQIKIPSGNILYLKDKLGLPIEDENVIFMFTLSSDNKIENIYAPNKRLSKLTETYLNITSMKLRGLYNLTQQQKN